MKYPDFENILSAPRIGRYKTACNNDSKKAMTLYRLNLRLSQELFTIVSCFEVAERNAIDKHYSIQFGSDWLRKAALPGGIFDSTNCRKTAQLIVNATNRLGGHYLHNKLVAEMDFGFWRYLFAQPQFASGGRTLLQIFPAKPKSNITIQYNNHFVFNELEKINNLRNRIAHHEPICFQPGRPLKDTTYIRQHYVLILQLFHWLAIDEAALLYGLDHINNICNQIDAL